MKRIFSVLLLFVTLSASAQEFKPFKFNISLGYAKPTGPGASGGVLFSLEPKYGVNDQFDIGLRYELAAMARAYTINGQDADGELKAASSFVLTGTYLISTNNFRPYVGVGAGLFSTAATGFTVTGGQGTTDGDIAAGTKFGGLVRAGFKAGHFNFGLEYNLIPKTTGIIGSVSGSNFNYESNNSYFGIKFGVDIGGGRY
ncbi:hypothetical protein GCM10027341_44400 [Spirosoma knui]